MSATAFTPHRHPGHARQRPQLLVDPAEELEGLVTLVAIRGGQQVERDEVLGPEARVDAGYVDEAPHEQARAEQERRGQGELRDDQTVAVPLRRS